MNSLAGKVAVVTGASRGIGAVIARRLAAAGAQIAVNYKQSAEAARKLAAEIVSAGGKAIAIQADVSEPVQIVRLFAETDAHFGRLDILVNNAGILEKRPLGQIDSAHIEKLFCTNLTSVVLATQEAAKRFDGARGGRVINLSSISARIAAPDRAIYAASKAAIESITRSYAAALAPLGVTVNAVAPGLIDTAMGALNVPPDKRQGLVTQTLLGRIGQSEDVSGIVAFLASDDARWITGEVIVATGGYRI